MGHDDGAEKEGKRRSVLSSGAEAAAHVAYALSDAVLAQPQLDAPGAVALGADVLSGWARDGRGSGAAAAPDVRVLDRAASTGGDLAGLGRAAVLTGSPLLRRMAGNLLALGARPLPLGDALVLHVGAVSQRASDGALEADLSDVLALRDSGCGILCAGSVQEIHDMGAAAHAVSARCRIPMVSFWDAARLSAQVAPARLLPAADLVDLAGADAFARGEGALEALEATLGKLGYGLFDFEGPADAETVVVACGAAAQCIADDLRAGMALGAKRPVGVLRVRAVRPWSAAHFLAALPRGVLRVCVVDQDASGAAPLFKDVSASFHADAQWAAPALVSANLVLPAATGLTPAVTAALLACLQAPSPRAAIALADLPVADLLAAPARGGEPDAAAALMHAAVSWGAGATGRAARSAMAVTLGPLLGYNVQACEFESRQAGVARCDVRFSPLEVAAEHAVLAADVISVDDAAVLLLPRCRVLAQARAGTRVLLNCPWATLEQLERELPANFRAALAARGAELFVADACALAGGSAAQAAWATQLLAAHLMPGGADYRQLFTHFSRLAVANLGAGAEAWLAKLAPGAAVEAAVSRVAFSRENWLRATHGDDAADLEREEHAVYLGQTFVPTDMAPAGMLTAVRPGAATAAGTEPAAEESYHALMQQLFGQRLLVSDTASGAATVAQSVETAYGAFLAQAQARERLAAAAAAAMGDAEVAAAASKELMAALGVWHACKDNAVRCAKVAPRLADMLAAEKGAHPALQALFEGRTLLEKASKWIVGGDNWAHDLSSNGIHHVLKSGLDVNVIVFDHDDYAGQLAREQQQLQQRSADPAASPDVNTSAMSVFATMTAASAVNDSVTGGAAGAPAAASKKKDIGLYAMNYGTAYVASVSALASQSQTLRALAEADAFKGPSVILAHAPRAHAHAPHAPATPIARSVAAAVPSAVAPPHAAAHAASAAVDSGAWPLYRWNPARRDDEFALDSAKLQAHIEEFLQREQQLSILSDAQPAPPGGAAAGDDDEGAAAPRDASLDAARAQQHAALRRKADQRRLDAQFDALAGATGAGSNPQLNLLVLYGSDGGNASAVAEKLAKKAEVSGCGEVRCMEANDVNPDDLAEESHLLLVLATAGQGEPCANAKHFCEALADATPKLEGLRFAVFGLGDSNYWGEGSADSEKYFCLNAREMDARLAALGARRAVAVGLGDDQDDDGYEGALKEWEEALWEALEVTIDTSKDLGGAPAIVDDDIKIKSNFLAGNIDDGLRDDTTLKLLPEDTKLTKFHGIYQQDLRSVREERIANKQELAYSFMIRIGLPGGVASSAQYVAMDDIVTQFSGNQVLKVTTRQAYQIHGVVKSQMKDTMKAINRAAMDTLAACGDVNRNVIGDQNRRRSKAHDEFNELARKLQAHLRPVAGGLTYASIWLDKKIIAGTVLEEPIYGETYLPRKFKIALAVNGEHNLVDVFAHCLGFIANIDNGRVLDLTVTVGGGMGTTFGNKLTYPRLSDVLGSCSMEQALAVAEAVVKVQRDHGERVNRKHSRLKYTVEDMGIEVFRAKVEELCGFALGKARPFSFPSNADEYGWRQGYDGLWDYTLFVESGRIMDADGYMLRTALREIALANDSGEMSLTATQNVVIGAVPEAKKAKVQELLRKYNIDNARYSAMRLHSMACVALPTCALAMAESQRYLPSLIDKLEDTLDECGLRHDAITIRMTGCPNGCARPYIAEIAFVGTAPGKYHLFLGGGHAGNRIARLYRQGIDEEEILAVLRPMLEAYARERAPKEHFGDFVIRKKIVEPVLHGRCFWVTDPAENDTTTPSGTTQIYW